MRYQPEKMNKQTARQVTKQSIKQIEQQTNQITT